MWGITITGHKMTMDGLQIGSSTGAVSVVALLGTTLEIHGRAHGWGSKGFINTIVCIPLYLCFWKMQWSFTVRENRLGIQHQRA